MSGITLVTLPIGNKDDITYRAKESLESAKYIYSEDTRVFKELCQKIGLDYSDKQIRSYHDHSSDKVLDSLLDIAKTEGCVFVSDAGSPLISDPAFPIVLKAIEQDITIHSNSGISAIVNALELSGLSPIPFHFHGFLPRDKGRIQQDLNKIKGQYGTHIFFEGKSRVIATLEKVSNEFPEFKICLCRELTKEFESVHRFVGKDFDKIKDDIVVKGEFVILIENSLKDSSNVISDDILNLAIEIIEKGAKPKKLAKLLSQITGRPSKEIYSELSVTRQ